MPNRATTGPDGLATTIGWLLAIAVALIGLDEFNIRLSFFALKPVMMPLALAVGLTFVRWVGGKELPMPRNLPALLFIVYSIFTCALFYVGATDTEALVNNAASNASTPITKTFNLILLFIFAYMGATFLTARQLYIGTIGLVITQAFKFFYILQLLLHAEIARVYWLPGGTPRFALNQAGMTPNQMGGIWLVATIILVFMIANRRGSLWRWCLVLIAGAGAVSTLSRSIMIGLAILAAGYTVVRPRFLTVLAVISAIVGGAITFAIYQSARIADASALDRFDKWGMALSNFQDNFLFGSGMGTNPAPHSVWLQLLSETGLVGFVLAMLAMFQHLVADGRDIRKAMEFTCILIVPYLFFMSVDIPFLQWQTWILPIAISVGYKEFALKAPLTRLAWA